MIASMLRFGPFAVDFSTAELQKHGVRVRMPEQPLRVLEALLKQPGELVSREDLRDRLWASDTFVDFERGLNAAVARLRVALNDSADHPLYVETVARKGYRFIAPVTDATIPSTPQVAEPLPPAEPEAKIPVWPKWLWPALAAVQVSLLALAFSFGASRKSQTDGDRRPVRLDLDTGNQVSQPAISPDGSRIVFVTQAGLAHRRLDDIPITLLKQTEGASLPFFSPDGRWVGFFARRKLMKVALDGGAPVTLCDAPVGGGASWGEDDNIIASLKSTGGLSRIPASGGAPQPFTREEKDDRTANHRLPQVLPGGKGTMFIAGHGPAEGALRVQPADGGEAKTLIERVGGGRYLSAGYLVYYQGGTLFGVKMDLKQLTLTGPASPLVEGVFRDVFRASDFDVSSSGTLVYRQEVTKPKRELAWIRSSGARESLGLESAGYITPRISPDEKRIALIIDSDGQIDLWMYQVEDRKITRLTFDGDAKCCPLWTPDGEFLLFSSKGSLAWTRSTGSGKIERIPPFDTNATPWSVSADGRWLTFHRNEPETGTDVWAAKLHRAPGALRLGPPQPIVRQAGVQAAPSISPDGRWLAHGSDDSGRRELYVIPFSPESSVPNDRWQISGDGILSPAWCRHCEAIFYRGLMDRRVRVVPYTVKGDTFIPGKARIWSEQQLADTGPFPGFDTTRDGTRILAILDKEGHPSDETHLRFMLNVNDELARRFSTH
jgi:serine/threonine-protein kinase